MVFFVEDIVAICDLQAYEAALKIARNGLESAIDKLQRSNFQDEESAAVIEYEVSVLFQVEL